MTTELIIESEDPGVKNAAISITKFSFHKGKLKSQILYCNMLSTPLDFVQGDIGPALKAYLKEIKVIRKKVGIKLPDIICRERFQARGLSGPVVEIISAAFGARALDSFNEDKDRRFAGIMASQWKRQAKSIFPLDDWYKKYCKPSINRKPNVNYIGPPHVLDSCLIGMYAAGKAFKMKNPFECISASQAQHQFLKQIKIMYQKGVKLR